MPSIKFRIIAAVRRLANRAIGSKSMMPPDELAESYRLSGVQIGTGTLLYHPVTLGRGGKDPIVIGNYCVLTGCTILGHDASTNRHLGLTSSLTKPTIIEDDCFIGVGAIVLMGVTIGKGSIVGAGAVVTKDVQPNSVVAGNPARVICSVQDLVARRVKSVESQNLRCTHE